MVLRMVSVCCGCQAAKLPNAAPASVVDPTHRQHCVVGYPGFLLPVNDCFLHDLQDPNEIETAWVMVLARDQQIWKKMLRHFRLPRREHQQ
jgi:hypothetical protein